MPSWPRWPRWPSVSLHHISEPGSEGSKTMEFCSKTMRFLRVRQRVGSFYSSDSPTKNQGTYLSSATNDGQYSVSWFFHQTSIYFSISEHAFPIIVSLKTCVSGGFSHDFPMAISLNQSLNAFPYIFPYFSCDFLINPLDVT